MGCDTPDELRQEADRLARRGDGADAHIVRAAADAWETQNDNNEKVKEALRKRLDAAEKLHRDILEMMDPNEIHEMDGPFISMQWVLDRLDAALAGEEKK